MPKNSNTLAKPKSCSFCTNNVQEINYKDIQTLRRFIYPHGKIIPKRRSGTCSKHQRKLATAIKRARIMALLPFTNK